MGTGCRSTRIHDDAGRRCRAIHNAVPAVLVTVAQLRIFYLEERLARARGQGSSGDAEELLSEELIEAKMALEDKTQVRAPARPCKCVVGQVRDECVWMCFASARSWRSATSCWSRRGTPSRRYRRTSNSRKRRQRKPAEPARPLRWVTRPGACIAYAAASHASVAPVSTHQEDLMERERLVSALRSEGRLRGEREQQQRERAEAAERTVRELQDRLKETKLEVERYRGLEATVAARDDEIKALQSGTAKLREQLAAMRALEATLREREDELRASAAESAKLQEDVVRLSEELGQTRGAAVAVQKQASEVAQLEAEEIARLEAQLSEAQNQVSEAGDNASRLARELNAKSEQLIEADRAAKQLEDKLDRAEEKARQVVAEAAAERAAAREREVALHERLKEATSREADLQGRSIEGGARETELVRQLAEVTSQVSEAEAAKHQMAEREADTRRELEEARAELRRIRETLASVEASARDEAASAAAAMERLRSEADDRLAITDQEAARREDEALARVRELESQLATANQRAKEREETLSNELRHWEQHVRSSLVEFFGDPGHRDASSRTHAVRDALDASRVAGSALGGGDGFRAGAEGGRGGGAPPAYGGDDGPDREDLLSALKRLPRLRRWFEEQARAMQAAWSRQLTALDERTRAGERRVAEAEAAVRPALVAVEALSSQRRSAELRAAKIGEEKGAIDAEVGALTNELSRLSAELAASKAREDAAADKLDRLSENNHVLILELEEKRSLADEARRAQVAAQREKVELLDAQARMRQTMRARDVQLRQRMAMLETQLSALGDAHAAGARSAEEIIRSQVLHTRELLRSEAVASGVGDAAGEGDGASAATVSMLRAMMEELNVHLERCTELVRDSDRLVSRTRDQAPRLSDRRDDRDDDGGDRRRDDDRRGDGAGTGGLRDLLDANARLSVAVKDVSGDVRVSFSKLQEVQASLLNSMERRAAAPPTHGAASAIVGHPSAMGSPFDRDLSPMKTEVLGRSAAAATARASSPLGIRHLRSPGRDTAAPTHGSAVQGNVSLGIGGRVSMSPGWSRDGHDLPSRHAHSHSHAHLHEHGGHHHGHSSAHLRYERDGEHRHRHHHGHVSEHHHHHGHAGGHHHGSTGGRSRESSPSRRRHERLSESRSVSRSKSRSKSRSPRPGEPVPPAPAPPAREAVESAPRAPELRPPARATASHIGLGARAERRDGDSDNARSARGSSDNRGRARAPPSPSPRGKRSARGSAASASDDGGSTSSAGGTRRGDRGAGGMASPGTVSKQRRMEELHHDMVSRLSKIGVDLQETATQITSFGGRGRSTDRR